MSTLFTNGLFHADDDAGSPLVGGKLYTYIAGTTTPTTTWADSALTIPNANPIILNARGEASVWIGTVPVRMQLRTSADVIVWDQDNIAGSDNNLRADLLGADSPSSGAGIVGFKWSTLYDENTSGWGVRTSANAVSILRYIPVDEWAAIANGSSTFDCLTAFSTAITNHSHIYLPPGTYKVGGPLDLPNLKRLSGSGERSSIIEATHTDATKPIIYLGGESVLFDLGLQYAVGIVTGAEGAGERVGVQTFSPTTSYACQRAGGIHRVFIYRVGTGVYDPVGSAAFSCEFNSIEINNFSYRGWDFRSLVRTGNIYRNLYIQNLGTAFANADSGFSLDGEESECTIEQLNVESATLNSAMRFFGVRGLSATAMHMEQVLMRSNSQSLIQWDRSSGYIGALTAYYIPIGTTDWSIVKIFDSTYDGALANPNTCNMLQIGTLHTKGLNNAGGAYNSGISALVGFYFISRPLAAVGDFFMQIDRYVWNTFDGLDAATYIAFPNDPQNRIKYASTLAGPPVGRILNTDGWVRRPDGMIEQWGRTNINAGTTLTVNFPIPFPVACRVQTAQPFDTSTVVNYRVNASPLSNTQFQISNTAAGVITAHWYALGH